MAQDLQGVCNEHQCLVGLQGKFGHALDQEKELAKIAGIRGKPNTIN